MKSFIRVNRKAACPVCGHSDWCSVSANRTLAFCMRIEEGSIKRARNGAFIHPLNTLESLSTNSNQPIQSHPKRERPWQERPQAKRTRSEKLNRVYSALLEFLTLEVRHSSDLLVRGLSQRAIKANCYKSTPSLFDASQVAFELSRKFDLCGVPGFFFDYGIWRMANVREGFFIPVRNTKGQIHGLQIRLDNPIEGKQKYLWFSSARLYMGASSSAPVHFSKPGLIHSHSEVLITEGALKADVISYFTNKPVIAAAGVFNFGEGFAFNLRKRFPSLRKTILCFDTDRYEKKKKQVRDSMFRLGNLLRRAYFDVSVCEWSDEFKGYDDFLVEQTKQKEEL